MNEHAAASFVTWKDFYEASERYASKAELVQRLKEIGNRSLTAAETAERALLLAREGVLKHDEEKNNLLAQINKERADYATNDALTAGLEKLSAALHSEMEAEKVDTAARIDELRSTARISSKDIGDIQKAENTTTSTMKGRDLGILGAAFTLLGVVLSSIIALLKDLLF